MKHITPPVCVGFALLLLAVTRCELSPSERFEPELCIHCLLFAGTSVPEAHVNRTYAINDSSSFVFPDAEVSLWQARDSWALLHVNNDRYAYPESLDIPPFDTFYLRVMKDGYDTVLGHTTIPDTFSILFPRPGDTITTEDSLTWTESRSCKGYYTSFRRETPRGDTFDINVLIANDSLAGYLPLFFLSQEPEGEYTFRLAALDTNYYNWVGAGGGFGPGSGMQQSGPPSTVTGGIGVFGSAALCSVRVYLKHDPVMGRPGQSPGSNRSNR
jgi:hypothetical protein